jgi:hypothetical protein
MIARDQVSQPWVRLPGNRAVPAGLLPAERPVAWHRWGGVLRWTGPGTGPASPASLPLRAGPEARLVAPRHRFGLRLKGALVALLLTPSSRRADPAVLPPLAGPEDRPVAANLFAVGLAILSSRSRPADDRRRDRALRGSWSTACDVLRPTPLSLPTTAVCEITVHSVAVTVDAGSPLTGMGRRHRSSPSSSRSGTVARTGVALAALRHLPTLSVSLLVRSRGPRVDLMRGM